MKLTALKKDLLSALQKAKKVTEKKTAVEILSQLQITTQNNWIEIKATDLENFLTLYTKALIEGEDIFLVNAETLTNVIKNIKGNFIVLETQKTKEEDLLIVKGENNTFTIPIDKDKEKYIEFPTIVTNMQIPSLELVKITKKIEHAIAKKDSRPALENLYINGSEKQTHFVTSDAHRLALYTSNINFPTNLLIPKKSLKIIQNLTENFAGYLQVGQDDDFAHFVGKNFSLSIRIPIHDYPNYLAVIPENFNYEIEVRKQELLQNLKTLASIAKTPKFPVKLSFFENMAKIQMEDSDIGKGENTISAKITKGNGQPIEIGFNIQYLIETLESIESRKVKIKIINHENPVAIEPENTKEEPYLNLIMPMLV